MQAPASLDLGTELEKPDVEVARELGGGRHRHGGVAQLHIAITRTPWSRRSRYVGPTSGSTQAPSSASLPFTRRAVEEGEIPRFRGYVPHSAAHCGCAGGAAPAGAECERAARSGGGLHRCASPCA